MPILLGLALLAGPAQAQDVGREVVFPPFQPAAAQGPGLDLGPSEPLGPFDVLLLHGRAARPEFKLEASIETAGGWGPWTELEVTRYPNGRFWAKLDAPGSRGRVRLRGRGAGAESLVIYTVQGAEKGLEPPPSKARMPPAGPARPSASPPFIISRGEWRAKPPTAAFWPDEPYRFTLHHTEGPRPTSLDDAVTEMLLIQDFHQRGRGWIDIGYHFVIDGAGRIFEGRPQTVVGAHTQYNNDGNLGISLMGDFRREDPSPAQLEAFVALARFLVKRYGIDPATLHGHRDYKSTDCPGDRLYAILPRLEKAIAAPEASPPPKVLPWKGGGSFVPIPSFVPAP